MPIAHRATSGAGGTTANTSQGSLVINKPTGTTTNDVLVAAFSVNDPRNDMVWPTGWQPLNYGMASGSHGQGGSYSHLGYKVITNGASEPTSYTFTFPTATFVGGVISCFSGVDTRHPIDVNPIRHAQVIPTTTTPQSPAITTRTNGAMILRVLSGKSPNSTAWTVTPPTGFTEPTNGEFGHAESVAYNKVAIAYALLATAGTQAALTFTTTTAVGHAHFVFALKPADAGTANSFMPPPAVVERQTNNSSTAARTSMVINKPTGTRAGDILFAVLFRDTVANAFSTSDSGWTFGAVTSNPLVTAWKLAGASEPASYTFTFTSMVAFGSMWAIRGADQASPHGASSSTTAAAASTAWVAPSPTNTQIDTLLFRLYGGSVTGASTYSMTPPVDHTEVLDMPNSTGATSTSAQRILAATIKNHQPATAPGTSTMTSNLSTGHNARSVHIRPQSALARAAAIAGKATVTPTGQVANIITSVQGAAAIAGKGTVTPVALLVKRGDLPINGKGTMTPNGTTRIPGSVPILGKGTVNASGVGVKRGGISIASKANIIVAGSGGILQILGAANIAGKATVSPTGVGVKRSGLAIASKGTVTPAALVAKRGAVSILGKAIVEIEGAPFEVLHPDAILDMENLGGALDDVWLVVI